jgi:hypothetical protein
MTSPYIREGRIEEAKERTVSGTFWSAISFIEVFFKALVCPSRTRRRQTKSGIFKPKPMMGG